MITEVIAALWRWQARGFVTATLLAISGGILELLALGCLLLLLGRLGLPTAAASSGRFFSAPSLTWQIALLAFIAIGIAQVSISRAAALSALATAQRFSASLRAALLHRFSMMPFERLRMMETTAIRHFLAEDTAHAAQAAQGTIGIITQSLLCAAYVIATVSIAPIAALAILGLAIPAILLNRSNTWKRDTRRLRNLLEQLAEHAGDYALNILAARIHQSTQPANMRYQQASSSSAGALLDYQRRVSKSGLIQQLVVFILFGLFVILLQIFSGDASSRLLPMAVIYLRLAPRVQALQQQRTALSLTAGSVGAIVQVLNVSAIESISAGAGVAPISGDIEVRNLTYEYTSGIPVLQLTEARFRQGCWTTVVGASGVGKSTLLRLLTGLEQPTSGQILVGGHALSQIDGAIWRNRLAYVEQTSYFFHGSLKENLMAFCQPALPSNEEMLSVVTACGLTPLIEKMPAGLSTVIDERGSQLSSGQKQRIGLGRALLRKPDLLLLDEATNALDENSERILMQSIKSCLPEATVISVSHRATAIAFGEFILKL